MANINVLIQGGRVVDGTGNPWFHGDVALRADRVVEVARRGCVPAERAEEVIDATGMVVCPGFIDIQSHSHLPLMVDGRCLSKITQGVTTEIMGESWTPSPFGGRIDNPITRSQFHHLIPEWLERARTWVRFRDWLEAMVERGVSPNIGSFLGGGTLREYVKGADPGPPTEDDLATMRRVMREAMQDGAFGVAYALIYPPDAFASTDEIVEVCKVVSECGGLYITHMRSEGDRFLEGLAEALEIGRRANLPVEIYHLKARWERNWHKLADVIAKVDRVRTEGLDVTAGMYPYTASATALASVLPPWAASGDGIMANLRDPGMRAKIRAEVLHPSGDWEPLGENPDNVMPVGFQRPENKQYVGLLLSEIAAMRGQDPIDAVIDLLLSEDQRIDTIYFTMQEENVRLKLGLPWVKISTDAGGFDPTWGKELAPCHPRAYGTYPRVLGKYVREENVLRLEEAIHKMTWAVADRLGLRQRGLLRPGSYADVVIFDPVTILDRATFEEPHQLSVGVRDVWVNGERVLKDGIHTGAMPGRIVAHRGT